jgi:predicted XRE-type DNA-binding protein
VFADLNLLEPDELLAKSALGIRIFEAIRQRGWTQAQVAAALDIPQPTVSLLMGAKLSGFSMERLLRLLLRLDCDIEIAVRPKREDQAHVRVA